MGRISQLPQGKTITIKTGTEAISLPNGQLNMPFLRAFTAQAAALRLAGNKVIIISSGAVGLGRAQMRAQGWQADPVHLLSDKAAAAGFGQSSLIDAYRTLFRQAGIALCAQFLVRNDDFSNGHVGSRRNILTTLDRMYALPGSIAVFNENDTVSYDENKPLCEDDPETFSDNDGLSSLLGRLVGADVSLTVSTHAVYTKNPSEPEAALVPYINFESDKYSLKALGISTKGTSCAGSGGMGNKLEQNRLFLQADSDRTRLSYIIAAGEVLWNGVFRALRGEPVGTKLVSFRPASKRSASLKL